MNETNKRKDDKTKDHMGDSVRNRRASPPERVFEAASIRFAIYCMSGLSPQEAFSALPDTWKAALKDKYGTPIKEN